MSRARAGILAGARGTIIHGGVRRMTMTAVADRGGVAKATVYNHFRSRGELLDGVLADEVEHVLALSTAAGPDPTEQLAAVAVSLANNPLLDAIRQHEPEVLAGLTGFAGSEGAGSEGAGSEGASSEGAGETRWDAALGQVRARLVDQSLRSDDVAIDLLLRWLLSIVLAPAADERLRSEAALVTAALSISRPRSTGTPVLVGNSELVGNSA